jgi:hypothetical protein
MGIATAAENIERQSVLQKVFARTIRRINSKLRPAFDQGAHEPQRTVGAAPSKPEEDTIESPTVLTTA